MGSCSGPIIVWGVGTSRAFRVHWALHELGLAYETRAIRSRTGETQTDDYTALNPKQKIPYLQDGDFGLSESGAIVQYLFNRYGGGADVHAPSDAQDRARVDEWCYFVMTEFDAHTLYIIRRHEGLADIYGAAPAVAASAREYFSKQLLAVTPLITDAAPYLFGSRISTADILLTTCLDWAQRYGINLPEAAGTYLSRLKTRPAYADAAEACYRLD